MTGRDAVTPCRARVPPLAEPEGRRVRGRAARRLGAGPAMRPRRARRRVGRPGPL